MLTGRADHFMSSLLLMWQYLSLPSHWILDTCAQLHGPPSSLLLEIRRDHSVLLLFLFGFFFSTKEIGMTVTHLCLHDIYSEWTFSATVVQTTFQNANDEAVLVFLSGENVMF